MYTARIMAVAVLTVGSGLALQVARSQQSGICCQNRTAGKMPAVRANASIVWCCSFGL
ncbi:MAG TPA: hypothetical protein VNY51_13555 [Candidatus Dormibacteraeota bacterium]|nr:hypothetical protein [Candidatus Dormibacteraeota bacterium]